MIPLLKELALAEASSGGEKKIAEILARELKEYVDSLTLDPLGNLIAYKVGQADGPKIMLTAHMDEIGARVASIERNGLLKFVKIGYFNDRILPARLVTIHTTSGQIPGVIGVPPPRAFGEKGESSVIPAEKLSVDIGAGSREEAAKLGVRVGDMICFKGQFAELAGGVVACKSLDDRVGMLVMVEVMKKVAAQSLNAHLYAVGTVQEEVGIRGAVTAAWQIKPDLCFPLDVTPHYETDDDIAVTGKGPVLRLFELGTHGGGVIVSPRLRDFIIQVAEKNQIPYQLLVRGGGRTEASEIHLVGKGVPSCAIEVPVRYLHTPMELVQEKDIQDTVDLLTALVQRAHLYQNT